MDGAHLLTPDDLTLLRRGLSRGWAGTVTVLVTMVMTVVVSLTAEDEPAAFETAIGGWEMAAGFTAFGLLVATLVLAYAAPRVGALCGAALSLSISISEFFPRSEGSFGPGPGPAAVAFVCATVLLAIPVYAARLDARQRALLRGWQATGWPPPVPDLGPATRMALLRPRVGRLVTGLALAAAAVVMGAVACADVVDSAFDPRTSRTVPATVESIDEYEVSHVVIDGTDYAVVASGYGYDQVGDVIRVTYDPTTGAAEDADAPYEPGAGALVTGLTAPFAAWLLGAEVLRRRDARRLLAGQGCAFAALGATVPGGGLRLDAEGARRPLGVWDRIARRGPARYPAGGAPGPSWEPSRVLVLAVGPDLGVVATTPIDGDVVWDAWRPRRRPRSRPVASPRWGTSPVPAPEAIPLPRGLTPPTVEAPPLPTGPCAPWGSTPGYVAAPPHGVPDDSGAPPVATPVVPRAGAVDGAGASPVVSPVAPAVVAERPAEAGAGLAVAPDQVPGGPDFSRMRRTLPWMLPVVLLLGVASGWAVNPFYSVISLGPLVFQAFLFSRQLPRLLPGPEGLRVQGRVLTRLIPWALVVDTSADAGCLTVRTRRGPSAPAGTDRTIVADERERQPVAPGCRTAVDALALIERERRAAVPFQRPTSLRLSTPLVVALSLVLVAALGAIVGSLL